MTKLWIGIFNLMVNHKLLMQWGLREDSFKDVTCLSESGTQRKGLTGLTISPSAFKLKYSHYEALTSVDTLL